MIPYTDLHRHAPALPGTLGIQNLMNPDTVEQQLQVPGLYSIGLHPWHLHPDHWQEDLALLEQFIQHPRVKAIGEAGLDRLTGLPLALQTEVFEAMITLSEKAKKPLIIHAVRTHHEIAVLHNRYQPSQAWILHGFNNKWTIAAAFAAKNVFFSFGAALLQHRAPAREVLLQIPLEKIFLESDDKELEMALLYQEAARCRETTEDELKENIYQRFCLLFDHHE